MMKSLYTIILLLSTMGIAHAADEPGVMKSPYYKDALMYVPEGGEITQIVPVRSDKMHQPIYYIHFDYQGSCYIATAGLWPRMSLTTVPCG
jgi:hypothetical protein